MPDECGRLMRLYEVGENPWNSLVVEVNLLLPDNADPNSSYLKLEFCPVLTLTMYIINNDRSK